MGAGFWGSLANVAAHGAGTAADQLRENDVARMKALVLAAALKRQQQQDALAAEERTYRHGQDAIQNRIKGYTPPSTDVSVDAPVPETAAPPAESFDRALTAGFGGAPASAPVALGSIPKVNVTSTPESFVDPDIAKHTAEKQAEADLRNTERAAKVQRLTGTRLPDGTVVTPQLAEAMVDNPALSSAYARAPKGEGSDPASVHQANRLFDIAHPLPQQENAKPTEFSNKAALVYPRAQQAAAVLDEFFTKGMPARTVLGKVTGGAYGMSADQQRAVQAAETISSAILRLESGAAISEHEVTEYAKQFLPQPGDKADVRAQKRATLMLQLERMKAAANPTMRREDAPASAPGAARRTAPPSVTTGDVDLRTAARPVRPDVARIRSKYGLEP